MSTDGDIRVGRTAILLTLVGGGVGMVLVVGAFVLGSARLDEVRTERDALVAERGRVSSMVAELTDSVSGLRAELDRVVCTLGSAAALNSFYDRQYTAAVEQYDRALECDPDDPRILNLKAYALFKAGDLDGAVEAQRQTVTVDPEYAWGYFDLARLLCAQGELDGARTAFERSVSLRYEMASVAEGDGEFQYLCREMLPE